MFRLKSASVHYGTSSYPLNGLDADLTEISNTEDLADELEAQVGRITGYPRKFTVKHIERQEFPGIKTKDGDDLVIPEQISAIANGYSIIWEKVA